MVIFRVDANSMIGKGHMKRCVSIAKAIKLLGGRVLFVTREDSDISVLENDFMEYKTVPSMSLGSEKAIDCLKEIIGETGAKVCVVDSYDVSDTAFKSLKEVCKVVLIEDYLYDVYDVDCVVNYNLYVEKLDYMSKYKGNTGLLLGMDYAPFGYDTSLSLRKPPINGSVESIMVYTGEVDVHEIAPGIVDSLLDCLDDSVRLRVVTSKQSPTRDVLFKMSNTSSQIIVEPDITSFPKLLKNCDIAVTVADSVCYDVLSTNIPACVFQTDYRQNLLLKSLTEKDLMVFGGDLVNRGNKFYGDLVEGVTTLVEEEKRKEICKNILGLDLGRGAHNLAKAIMNYEQN